MEKFRKNLKEKADIEKAEAVCYDSYRNEENLKDRKK